MTKSHSSSMVIPFPIVTSGLISVKKKSKGFWSLRQSLEVLFFNKVRAYSKHSTFLKIFVNNNHECVIDTQLYKRVKMVRLKTTN